MHGNFGFMEIDGRIDFLYLSYFVTILQSQQTLHFSTIYVYVIMTIMDPFEPILNLCTLAMFHLHGEEPI
jgi:hypothetical protein